MDENEIDLGLPTPQIDLKQQTYKDDTNYIELVDLESQIVKVRYQSPFQTVFSLTTTMMGSAVVSLPFGFSNAGIGLGLVICALMGMMCLYTCLLYIKHSKGFHEIIDFAAYYLGKRVRAFVAIVSIFVLVGALAAYFILMKESMYFVVKAIMGWSKVSEHTQKHYWNNLSQSGVILLVFPLTMMKHVKHLVKFNSFGFLFLSYIIFFICYHGVGAIFGGGRVPLSHMDIHYFGNIKFSSLTGMLALGFFIHNAIFSMTKQCNPRTKQRDIGYSFLAVGSLYAVVGLLGYLGFAYGEIQDNFLSSFAEDDLFAFSARCALFIQLFSTYPIIAFVVRNQICEFAFKSTEYRGFWFNLCIHVPLVMSSFAVCYFEIPVSDVLRYTGSFAGLVLVFFVPVLIHWRITKNKTGKVTLRNWVFHSFFLVIAVLAVVIQFV